MSFVITDGLCTLDDVKAALRITDTNDDDRIGLAIDSASRLIESICETKFTQDAEATDRVFVPTGPKIVEVDEFQTTDGLVVATDPGGDGTYEITWDASDYQLEPLNGLIRGRAWPYNAIRAIRSLWFPVWGNLTLPVEPYKQATVKVTARWGWAEIPTRVTKAAIVQSISIFKADDTPFGVTPFAEVGILRLREALHPTAALLLADYMEDEFLIL